MKKWVAAILLIVIVGLGIMGSIIYKEVIEPDRQGMIYEGVYLENIDLGGMTKEEARSSLDYYFSSEFQGKIELSYEGNSYVLYFSDLGLKIDTDDIVDQAFDVGRDGNLFKRYQQVKGLKNKPYHITIESQVDQEALDEKLIEIALQINQDPVDASISVVNGQVMLEESQLGKQVNFLKTRELVLDALAEPTHERESILIPVNTLKPEYETDYFSKINGVIGEFTTSFSGSSSNRKENIRISTEVFNHKLLMPGEVISFNNTTGPRSAENGYREAGVIVGNKLESGLGGGVCQTSTTLYNAALRANLEILERRNHTMPIGYVARGTDAAVSYGALDLKFKNNNDYPVYLISYVAGDNVTFQIFGDRSSRDYEVSIFSELVGTYPGDQKEVLDPNAEPGSRVVTEQGRTGYKYQTFKSIIRNGEAVETSLISSDYYPPAATVYTVGPAKEEGQTVEENTESPLTEDQAELPPED